MLSISGSAPVQPSELPPPPSQPLDTPANRAPVADGVSRMLNAASADGASLAGGVAGEGVAGERELVASEDSVTAGGVRDAYDMRLYREAEGGYTLEMNMKVDFNFTRGPDGQTWTPQDKQQFMSDFNQAIEDSWSGHTLATDSGEQVKLDVNLDLNEDAGDRGENWNIEVVKIDEGGFNQSYIVPSQNTGRFDSEDVKPIPKGASDPQVAAAHEFGHMIGLPDEYNGRGGPEAQRDTDSIMHTGMDVRERHFDIVENWVNNNT